MKLIINVKTKPEAINAVEVFKKRKYVGKDIRFTNVWMKKLNKILNQPLFDKNDLFIDSGSLWELMQEEGGSGKHNYHGLTPEDIIIALNSITEPYALIESKTNRYAIITTTLSHFNEPLMIVVEIGARLYSDLNANINKIVTMYPRSNVDSILNKLTSKEIYYKKKK